MIKKFLSVVLTAAMLFTMLPASVFADDGDQNYSILYDDMTKNLGTYGGGNFSTENSKLVTVSDGSAPVSNYYQHDCIATADTGIRIQPVQVSEGDIILASYWVSADYESGTPLVKAFFQYTKNGAKGGTITVTDPKEYVSLESGKWYKRYMIYQAEHSTTGLTTGDNCGFRFVLTCNKNIGQLTKLGELALYTFGSDFSYGGKSGVDAVRAYVGESSLSSISNSGTELADFNPETKTYYVPEEDYGEITATAAGMFADVSIDSSDESKTVITVKSYPADSGGKTEYGKETKTVYTVIKGEATEAPDGDVLSELTPADTMSSMVFFGMDYYDGEKVVKEYDLSGEDAPVDTAMKYVGKQGNNRSGGGMRGNSAHFKAPEAGSYVLVSYWIKAEMTGTSSAKPVIASKMTYIKENGTSGGSEIKDIDGNDKIELPEAGKWYRIYNIFKIETPTSGGDKTSLRFYLGCSQYVDQVTYFGGYKAYLFEPDYTYGGKDNVEDSVKALIGNNKLSSITNNDEMITGFDPDTYEYSIAADALGEIRAYTDETGAEVTVDNSDSAKIKINVSQPYCFNDGAPCEYGKVTSREYTINVSSSPVLPPEDDDENDETDEKTDLIPADTMDSMVFYGGTYYDKDKSVTSLDISDEDAPISTAMKYVGIQDGTTVGGGIRGATPDFKIERADTYVLVTYWVKGVMTDDSGTLPMISSKMTYIQSNGTSSYGEIKDIDGDDAIVLPESGKWYKIYNLFKIKDPTSGGEMSAVRFVLGCSKYLSQEIYFGGYNAYVFEPDFSYGTETDAEKAIINYVQNANANSISLNGNAIEGFEPDYHTYAIEANADVKAEDFTADVCDFSKYSAEISKDGKNAVVTVESHSFAGCNEYGVYPNKGIYNLKLMAPGGFKIRSTKLEKASGASADALTAGNYILKVNVENTDAISPKLFAVLYNTSCQKMTAFKIKDVQPDVSDYEFEINVPEGDTFELGVFAADDFETPVALTNFVSVAKSGEADIGVNPLITDTILAMQNMNTYTVDASAVSGSDYSVKALVIATEKEKPISESTIAYAKVINSSNNGRLDFAFTPDSDGDYTLYVSNGVTGEILNCDFGYYSKESVDKAAGWFETASVSDVKSAFQPGASVDGVPTTVLLGGYAGDVGKIDDISYVASALAGKKYASYEEFAADLAAAVEESLICESFKKADVEELDKLIEKYGEKSSVNLDENYGYTAFDQTQKKSIVNAVRKSNYTSSSGLYEVINEAIMLEVFNSFAWGSLEGALEFFEDDAGIDMSGFNKLPSSKQINVLKGMSAAKFDGLKDIPNKLDDLVAEQKKAGTTGGGGGGGSSKGSSGYDSFYSTDATPVPSAPDRPLYVPMAKFSDVPYSHWANPYVEDLSGKGIVSGDGNGLFYPERNLTRAEYVKMAVLAFGLYDANAVSEFTDCRSGAWYDSYVASGVNAGIISGMGNGIFSPDAFITRQDMAVIALRCLELSGKVDVQPDDAGFADDALIADYAKDAVYIMKAMNIINGMGDGSFSPSSNATRAMASKVIDLLMQA